MELKRPSRSTINVMANVRAFLAAAGRSDYTPEDLAEILYFHPVTTAEAMYRLGLLDRRDFERRAARHYLPADAYGGEYDRRSKQRRFSD